LPLSWHLLLQDALVIERAEALAVVAYLMMTTMERVAAHIENQNTATKTAYSEAPVVPSLEVEGQALDMGARARLAVLPKDRRVNRNDQARTTHQRKLARDLDRRVRLAVVMTITNGRKEAGVDCYPNFHVMSDYSLL